MRRASRIGPGKDWTFQDFLGLGYLDFVLGPAERSTWRRLSRGIGGMPWRSSGSDSVLSLRWPRFNPWSGVLGDRRPWPLTVSEEEGTGAWAHLSGLLNKLPPHSSPTPDKDPPRPSLSRAPLSPLLN